MHCSSRPQCSRKSGRSFTGQRHLRHQCPSCGQSDLSPRSLQRQVSACSKPPRKTPNADTGRSLQMRTELAGDRKRTSLIKPGKFIAETHVFMAVANSNNALLAKQRHVLWCFDTAVCRDSKEANELQAVRRFSSCGHSTRLALRQPTQLDTFTSVCS